MWSSVAFLTFALYPGISIVDASDFDEERYPLNLYWQFTGIGFFAGILLAFINQLTHRLSSIGMLRHEAQMNFWANLLTVCLVPIFVTFDFSIKQRKNATKDKCLQMLEFEILGGLFGLFLLKNVFLERSIMKRFVEDQSGNNGNR